MLSDNLPSSLQDEVKIVNKRQSAITLRKIHVYYLAIFITSSTPFPRKKPQLLTQWQGFHNLKTGYYQNNNIGVSIFPTTDIVQRKYYLIYTSSLYGHIGPTQGS